MNTVDDLRFDHGEQTPERLKGQLSRLVGMTALQLRHIASDALRTAGAHKDHFIALAALAEFGPESQAALSGRTRIYKSDLVSVLNDLADRGLVHRTPDPNDKRRNIITITAAGESQLAELDSILEGVNEHVMSPLNREERAQLFELLGRINTHLANKTDSARPKPDQAQ